MIVSHKHSLIFVGTAKTGSTAAVNLLARHLPFGDSDIVVADSVFSDGSLGRNVPHVSLSLVEHLHRCRFSLGMSEQDEVNTHLRHISPYGMMVAGILTDEQLNGYRSFGFVREPVNRYLSAYAFLHWRRGALDDMNPKQLCRDIEKRTYHGYFAFMPQEVSLRGVTDVLRYDSSLTALRSVFEYVGQEMPDDIPRMKSGFRPAWLKPDALPNQLRDQLCADYHADYALWREAPT